MADVIKFFLVPGSISFLFVGLGIGLLLLYGTERM